MEASPVPCPPHGLHQVFQGRICRPEVFEVDTRVEHDPIQVGMIESVVTYDADNAARCCTGSFDTATDANLSARRVKPSCRKAFHNPSMPPK